MASAADLLHAVDITDAVRDSVARLVADLGDHRVVVVPGWQLVAEACGVGADLASESSSTRQPLLVVGPIDHHLKSATGERLGFISPGAIRRKVWQREPTHFEDPTMAMWRHGLSPIAVDRIEVATAEATVELVIGLARPTPNF